MPKGYNSLNDIPVNFYEIGLCPVCSRRLTAECEHRNEQSEVWYAAQILAEQELFTATVPDDNGLPFLALSDTVAIAVTPQLPKQPRYILSRSWADKHLNSDDDLKYFEGGAVIK